MPNNRKPAHLKAVAGTARPCREAPPALELPPVSAVPEPPLWLPNAHAVTEWQRIAPILVNNKLLTDADLSALGQLCALHGKCIQLYAAGEAPTASMIGTLRTLFNDFGLTPVARGKVRPTSGEEEKGNPFAKHKRKQS